MHFVPYISMDASTEMFAMTRQEYVTSVRNFWHLQEGAAYAHVPDSMFTLKLLISLKCRCTTFEHALH